MRDDFPLRVKELLAKRVGNRCSNPGCRKLTSGPQTDPQRAINIGIAAHVTAASPGGARYDPTLSPEQRGSVHNGIWLCQTCGKLIDSDELRYSVELLQEWKVRAESAALHELENPTVSPQNTSPPVERPHEGRWFTLEFPQPRRYGPGAHGGYVFEFGEIVITNRTNADVVLNVAHRVRAGETSYYTHPEYRVRIPAKDFASLAPAFELHSTTVAQVGGPAAVSNGNQYLRLRDVISGHEGKHWI